MAQKQIISLGRGQSMLPEGDELSSKAKIKRNYDNKTSKGEAECKGFQLARQEEWRLTARSSYPPNVEATGAGTPCTLRAAHHLSQPWWR